MDAPRPNPSRDGATLGVFMPQDGPVRVTVYDIAGRRVGAVFTGQLSAGDHVLLWDGRGTTGGRLAGGVYHVVSEAFGRRVSQSLIVTR